MLKMLQVAFLLMAASGLQAAAIHPFEVPQPDSAPQTVLAGIEISAGSFSKYEIDPDHGHLVLDRFQTMPVAYPANYGFLPATNADDGDTMDVLVLTREAVVPGAFIRVRPIGILRLLDGGERDDKIIAVPAGDVDPDYADVHELSDLPSAQRNRIEAFFRVYKDLPEGRKSIEIEGYGDAAAARQAIIDATQSP